MTSPVDTSVKFAHSDMPGAPVLKPQAGSLISLLDAFLVNGWGLQTATSVVVAGGVATATFPLDHAAAVDAVVLVAGATPAALNGEQKVTATAPNKISWATGAADGTATGTITVKMAAAGWAKPFTGTNLAAYRSAHPQSNGLYLRVNDASALAARVVGYETMTAISTGANTFPTNAQMSGGGYWNKAQSAHGRDIPWLLFSDGRVFHLCILATAAETSDPTSASSEIYSFGDPVPTNAAGHPFGTLISFSTSQTVSNGETTSNAGTGLYAARSIARTVGPRPLVAQYATSDPSVFPDPAFGGLYLAPIRLRELDVASGATSYPGVMPGVMRVESTGVHRVLGRWPIVRVGPRRYLLQLIDNQSLNGTSSNSAAFDLTGPWR